MGSAPRPPTSNILQPLQRSRLLKSCRKLQDIFGATPHVLETFDYPHCSTDVSGVEHRKLKRRQRKLHTHPIRLHLAPLGDGEMKEKGTAHPHVTRVCTCDLPTPLPLTAFTPPLSIQMRASRQPEYLDEVISTPHSIYRKRTAKLSHLLGEHIPPELIYRQQYAEPVTSLQDGDTCGGNRKRQPISNCLSHSLVHASAASPTSSPIHRHHFPTSSSSYASLSTTLPPKLPPIPATDSLHSLCFQTGHGSESVTREPPRSSSVDPERWSTPPLRRPTLSLDESSRFRSYSVPYPSQMLDQDDVSQWDGEWSVKDAKTRAMTLRNLKRR